MSAVEILAEIDELQFLHESAKEMFQTMDKQESKRFGL
jgi:hypothetical protein